MYRYRALETAFWLGLQNVNAIYISSIETEELIRELEENFKLVLHFRKKSLKFLIARILKLTFCYK